MCKGHPVCVESVATCSIYEHGYGIYENSKCGGD